MKASIEIEAVDALVNGVVEAALTEALSVNSDKVIRALVTSVLNEKDPKSYGGETLLRRSLKASIRELTRQRVAVWFTENQSAVMDVVNTQIAEQLSPAIIADQILLALKELTAKLSLASVGKKAKSSDDDEVDY